MKVSGSYASLMRGVSQQDPRSRQPGQHTEQVNLISDPVNGLARRHGSRWLADHALAGLGLDDAELLEDSASYRKIDFSYAGKDYLLAVRTGVRPLGSDLPVIVGFNLTDNVGLTVSRPAVDTYLDTFEGFGCSAHAGIGKFLYMAGNGNTTVGNTTSAWSVFPNASNSVVWIRGGAYSRTFTVRATKTDETVVEFSYTTPKSSYDGVLDTSGVPVFAADPAGGTTSDTEAAYIPASGLHTLNWAAWNPTGLTAKNGTSAMTNVYPASPTSSTEFSWVAGLEYVQFHSSNVGQLDITVTYTHTKTVTNPNYAKIVSDLTNAYNSAVTEWIGSAAAAIQPENIAEQLKLAAVAAGLTTATREDGTVVFDNVTALSVSDGGDGTLIRGVAQEVASADQVSDVHYVGKVVRVKPRGGEDSYYLKAIARNGTDTGVAQVTWIEGAHALHTITSALIFSTIKSNVLYIAGSAAGLAALTGDTIPDYVASTVGDNDSSPMPFFVGRKITFLGVFQDRLAVGSGAVLRFSKIGDYLNFFRSSVLTVPADDPLELLSQGSEDDELRWSVMYDRDMVTFGKKRQYAISGRVALTPTSANMPVMSSHSGAGDSMPLAVGGVIFYGQRGESTSSMNQIQPGSQSESPESFVVSSQLNSYLGGDIVELSNHAKPAHLFCRTSDYRYSVFCFTYLDKQGEGRVQDAWSRWDFSEDLGPILATTQSGDGLVLLRVKRGVDKDAVTRVWLSLDRVPLTTEPSSLPYLDSVRPWTSVLNSTGPVWAVSSSEAAGEFKIAYSRAAANPLFGNTLDDRQALFDEFGDTANAWVGAHQEAYVIPTNPMVRDRNDIVVSTGRLTITKLFAGFTDTSGFSTEVAHDGGTTTVNYSARNLSGEGSPLNGEVLSTFSRSIPIGKETRKFTLKIKALTWLPFSLTTLEWVGQFFNRTQRL